MAVTSRTPDEILGNNLNDGVFSQNITTVGDSVGEDGLNDFNGGGSIVQSSITSNVFIFNISSNENSFTILVNGDVVTNNKQLRISRADIAKETKKIEIKKTGFRNNNEYYIVEMIPDGAPIINNPRIDQPLGITTKDVVLTKYQNGQVVGTPTSIRNNISVQLNFNLTKLNGGDEYEEPTKYNVSFNITGNGSPVSILKNGNKSAEFFPTIGNSQYEDVNGTKYIIRSSDASLYRIASINLNDGSKVQNLVAEPGETLELDVTLTKNYLIEINTNEIFQGSSGLNPQIELLKTNAREYNINSKVGVPLAFRKNEDVKTITVIVGDDVLEFDDLDKGSLCGITIPHSVFKNIGKYNIEIFPFSLDDYENEVRPSIPADTVETKKVKVKYDVREEIKLPEVTLSDNANLYKPRILRGSGLSGGSFFNSPYGDNYFDSTNPFENREDFIQRPNINEAIR